MHTLQPEHSLQNGKYTIKKVLGHGGFGITYLALHNFLGTEVAIKEFFMKDFCLRNGDTSNVSVSTESGKEQVRRFREKFIKEARNIARLKHPNIVVIHDIFEENGTAYYVMELCPGGSLSDLIENSRDKKLPEKEAYDYICQVASAIDYIHQRHMNHLDIKPSNILLNDNGQAILIDFGLSKQYDDNGTQTSTTPVGISHGYAPLEQYKQGGVREFSPQTDIYALGATFYKLITGQTPPDAQDLLDDVLPSFGASTAIKDAIFKAMQPRKTKRPESIAAWLSIFGSSCSAVKESNNNSVEPSKEPKKAQKISLATEETLVNRITKGNENGHEWVDLGLSVKWATCNLGAGSPSNNGLRFAWGERSSKSSYTAMNYDGDTYLDAANNLWGGSWRIPTKEEMQELINECDWQWTGKAYRITSPKNGNSILLPAGGWMYGDSYLQYDIVGNYWTSDKVCNTAWRLFFDNKTYTVNKTFPYYGITIRPVI